MKWRPRMKARSPSSTIVASKSSRPLHHVSFTRDSNRRCVSIGKINGKTNETLCPPLSCNSIDQRHNSEEMLHFQAKRASTPKSGNYLRLIVLLRYIVFLSSKGKQ